MGLKGNSILAGFVAILAGIPQTLSSISMDALKQAAFRLAVPAKRGLPKVCSSSHTDSIFDAF